MRFLILIAALALLAYGSYNGLFVAPPDAMMGDVQRIMYVHVPAAWMACLAFFVAFLVNIFYLFKRSPKVDALAVSIIEVGVFFNTLLLILGAIWGKPTWGTYWTWDPRLTTALIMCMSFTAYLGLRQFIDDPERRSLFAAIFAIVASVNLPLVWFSVRWWRSLHQIQSSPETVAHSMATPLRINAFAFLGIGIFFAWQRYLIERKRAIALEVEP